jgi:peptidoglycan/LPS O-acetylase OafA/YrhL
MSVTGRNETLDAIRAAAALAVVAGHVRNFLFVDWGRVSTRAPFDYAFYFVTGLGHQAVIVFFVLSGYFVGGSVVSAFRGGGWSGSKYLVRRLVRLEIVLVPALILTLTWDRVGMLATGGAGYDGSLFSLLHSGPDGVGPIALGAPTFLANVSFLMGISAVVYGSNGPLWSLANEFWYYILFPLLCYAIVRGGRRRVAAAVAGFAIAAWLPASITAWFLVWLLGVGAWWAGAPSARWQWRSARWWGAASAAAFALAIVASRAAWIPAGLVSDLAVGLACSAFLTAVAAGQMTLPGAWTRALATRCADSSYTVYLVHFPLVAVVWFTWLAPRQYAPTVAGYGAFTMVLTLVLSYAYGIWWCFERNTDVVRRWIERRLLA